MSSQAFKPIWQQTELAVKGRWRIPSKIPKPKHKKMSCTDSSRQPLFTEHCLFHSQCTHLIYQQNQRWLGGRLPAAAGRLIHDPPSPSAPQSPASVQPAPSQTGLRHRHLLWHPPTLQPLCSVACSSTPTCQLHIMHAAMKKKIQEEEILHPLASQQTCACMT